MYRLLPVIFLATFFAMDAYSPLGPKPMWQQGQDYIGESYASFMDDQSQRPRKRSRRMTQRERCNYRSGFSFYDGITKEICRRK